MLTSRADIDQHLDNIRTDVQDIRMLLAQAEEFANQDAEQLDFNEIREMQSSVIEAITSLKQLEDALC